MGLLLFSADGDVVGIVDWDRLSVFPHPLLDAIHMLMIAAEQGGLCSADQFLISLLRPRIDCDDLRAAVHFFLGRTGSRAADLPYLALMLWLWLIHHDGVDAPAQNDTWYSRVIGKPAEAVLARFSSS